MVLYPNLYINNVKEITIEILNKNNIKGLLLDVDNTLIDYYRNMPEGIQEWCEQLKKKDIKMCILSNSNKLDKIQGVATKLAIPYISFAKKPLKGGFIKGKAVLELEENNIAVVGDQIMTDVWGGNKCNMFTILVKPIHKKDIWITKVKRPLEGLIVKRYLKKNKGSNT